MNVFFLSHDPLECARYHCDKHVVKMILEYAQLLSTAHHVHGTAVEGMYKKTHVNHPSAVWVRESREAYDYVSDLLRYLLLEYTVRYGKVHKTSEVYRLTKKPPDSLTSSRELNPPLCMPDEYKSADPVESYRAYYIGDKSRFAKWKDGGIPPWWPGVKDAVREVTTQDVEKIIRERR